MGGDFDSTDRSRLWQKTLSSLSRGLRAADRRVRIGGGVRFLLGSAIEFLVEDSCVLCRRPHSSPPRPEGTVAGPAGFLLEPVVLSGFFGALEVRNRPFCAPCAERLVAARSAGVLGRRVGRWCIETEIGGTFGSPDGVSRGNSDGTDGGEDSASDGGEASEGLGIRILSPFMTTTHVLDIVHHLKFGGYVGLVGPMGRAMAWAVRSFAGESGTPPWIVPVPMDPKSLRRRGFNAAERLARRLSAEMGFPLAEALCKTARTRPQSKTPSGDRAANVRNAFGCPGEGVRRLAGRPVFLVDDLVTTGATSAACGAALLRAGAARVTVVCFGRAM
jgi:predicted amidophosphoribosyltransferase